MSNWQETPRIEHAGGINYLITINDAITLIKLAGQGKWPGNTWILQKGLENVAGVRDIWTTLSTTGWMDELQLINPI